MRANIDHRLFGIHSGFPVCCVEFWCTEWNQLSHEDRLERFEQQRAVEEEIGRNVLYVPCPDCFAKRNFVKTHHCDVSCAEFLVSQVGLPLENVIMSILENVISGKVLTPAGYLISDFKIFKPKAVPVPGISSKGCQQCPH